MLKFCGRNDIASKTAGYDYHNRSGQRSMHEMLSLRKDGYARKFEIFVHIVPIRKFEIFSEQQFSCTNQAIRLRYKKEHRKFYTYFRVILYLLISLYFRNSIRYVYFGERNQSSFRLILDCYYSYTYIGIYRYAI